MYETQKAAALSCLRAAEQNRMSFPQILGLLSGAGFEGYTIDFRQGTACYVLPSGEHVSFACPVRPVAPTLDVPGLQSAIHAAQAGGPIIPMTGSATAPPPQAVRPMWYR